MNSGLFKFLLMKFTAPLEQSGYFTEETPLSPNSPYSASKASADLLVRSYYKTYGLNAILHDAQIIMDLINILRN